MNKQLLNKWQEMQQELFNFVNQKVKDADLAQDIVQDVFIKVFTKIDSLKNQDKVVAWIFQITRNEINTHFRKQTSKQQTNNSISELTLNDNYNTEFSKCILPMIETLPEIYQQALLLTEIEGVSQKELALKLQISYSGAKSRVQRGRELLKISLKSCCKISVDSYGNIVTYDKSCKHNCN